jgi:ribose 5-phosphate isomerase RpiB
MRVGIATDHGGFGLKEEFVANLRAAGHEVIDFGAQSRKGEARRRRRRARATCLCGRDV